MGVPQTFIDGFSKIEVVGSTIRMHGAVMKSTDEKDKVNAEDVIELIIPAQEFPRTAKVIGDALNQFIQDKLYQPAPQKPKEE